MAVVLLCTSIPPASTDYQSVKDADGFEVIDAVTFDDTIALGNWLIV
jgi:hypothetical protein